MDGLSVGDKLAALILRDAKRLGDSVERCFVDDSLVGNVAVAGLYDSTSHRFLPGLSTLLATCACDEVAGGRTAQRSLLQMS
jgi:hypothetical protein